MSLGILMEALGFLMEALGFESKRSETQAMLVSCPACVRLSVKNGLMNKVDFSLIHKKW